MEKRKVVAKVDMSKFGLSSRPASRSSTTSTVPSNGLAVKAKVNATNITRPTSLAPPSRPRSPVLAHARTQSNVVNGLRPRASLSTVSSNPSTPRIRAQLPLNPHTPPSPVVRPAMSPPGSVTSDDGRSALSAFSLPSPSSSKFSPDAGSVPRLQTSGSIRVRAKVSGGIKALAANSSPIARPRADSITSSPLALRSAMLRPRSSPISALQFQSFPQSDVSYYDPAPPSQSPPTSSLSSRSSHSAVSSKLTSTSSVHTANGYDDDGGENEMSRSTTEIPDSDDVERSDDDDSDSVGHGLDAKSTRKILDLEISNKSLLTINGMLEATKLRQAKEIRDLRRKLREAKLHLPPIIVSPGGTSRRDQPMTSPTENDEESESSSSEEEQHDPMFDRCKGLLDSLLLSATNALLAAPEDVAPTGPRTKVLTAEELERLGGGGGGDGRDPETSTHADQTSAADSDEDDFDDVRLEPLPITVKTRPPSLTITTDNS